MDLLSLTSAAAGVVNPTLPMQVRVSTGSTPGADGRRAPTYAPAATVAGQVQPLTGADLRQLDGLNVQGSMNAIYFEGHVEAVVRFRNKGGDLVTAPDGTVYLTTQVLEDWPDWCRIAVTLQNGS